MTEGLVEKVMFYQFSRRSAAEHRRHLSSEERWGRMRAGDRELWRPEAEAIVNIVKEGIGP